jgi:hypothetical protein
MSPRRPRRRARRRSPARPLILLGGTVVVLALLVGGLNQVSRQSQDYDANSARALAAQGSVIAAQSNATASQVRTLIDGMPGLTRQSLQAALDGAVAQSADDAARAGLAVGSTPLGPVATRFAAVFSERAQAMAELQAAVDGFLGMQPPPPAGSSPDATTVASSNRLGQATPLSASQASNEIGAAGALLARSDGLYRSVRRSLAAAAGHARLPASVWVADPQPWQPGTVAAQVDLMATSPTLAASHYLVLRTVRLNPPALPTPPGVPATVSVLSPTSQLGVTTVLGNNGSADEPHASVRFSLANQSSGATATQVESAPVALGASVTLPAVSFRVKPGSSYVLTVSVILPAGQAETANTVVQQSLQVAPGT